MKNLLLTRDQFRESVFQRDGHKCVYCGAPAKDAHHIIERRLFSDGGYYLDNGASLCQEHHIAAEQTILSPQDLRELIGIKNVILPEHLYESYEYDKWGNIVNPDSTRNKGDLFYDESVQKILKEGGVLNLFSKYVKYPRTYHLSFSNLLKDDRQHKNENHFAGKEVVCTLKYDGENISAYRDYIHARSLDWKTREDRKYVKGLWSQIAYLIDEDMRICGENMYASHTIKYETLKSYFYIFSIWKNDTCLSWQETVELSEIFGFPTVDVIYEGVYDEKKIIDSFKPFENDHEGYVVRLKDEFSYRDFKNSVSKYVKPVFRQMNNDSHGGWISKKIIKNELATR